MTPVQQFPENTKSMNIKGTLGVLLGIAGVVIMGAGRAEDALNWGQIIAGGLTAATGFYTAIKGQKDGPAVQMLKDNGQECVKSEAQRAAEKFNTEWGANRLKNETTFQAV